MLSKAIKSLLELPDYHEDEIYLSTMVSFWCIIEPLLDIIKPSSICEIGSYRGITSKKLAEYCKNGGQTLSVVDPAGFADCIKNYTNVNLYQERSISFFKRKIPIDLYFIDGDHNYQTVMLELEAGLNNHIEQSPVYILHDISWPCAFRDHYCDYESFQFKGAHPHKANAAVVIDSENLAQSGLQILEPWAVAIKYGGAGNGVLKAVEDFQKKFAPDDWCFWKIPSLFGLGILFRNSKMPKDMVKNITSFLGYLEPFRPLLGVLEANRLRVLQSYFEVDFHLKAIDKERVAQQSRADDLEVRLKDSDAERVAQQSRADDLEVRLKDSDAERVAQQSRADDLEVRLKDSDAERVAQQSRADDLEVRLKDSDAERTTQQLRCDNLEVRLKNSDERNGKLETKLNIIQADLDTARGNRWYRFGQLSRRRKIWVIYRTLMKKIFRISINT